MRRALTGLAVSVLMLPALAGSATAEDGWAVEVQSAYLLAKGAAVEVTFGVVCPSLPFFSIASTDVTQRVNGNRIASGETFISNPPLTCDSSTVNVITGVVVSDSGVAFKNGVALVSAQFAGMAQDIVELKLQKAH